MAQPMSVAFGPVSCGTSKGSLVRHWALVRAPFYPILFIGVQGEVSFIQFLP